MSKIQKSSLTVNGSQLRMSMPFAKVDQSKRLVSGWATLDNIDTQNDVVLASASAKAFARARGNIREMHQPIAVGRMVDFREDEYYDEESKSLYRGIFVTARVSKGAEDTWEKVLDGTLTGFSIGGSTTASTKKFVPEANGGKGAVINYIEDYNLEELSLVDNPANQLANVDSIQKSLFSIEKDAVGSVKVTPGEAMVAEIEFVLICENHDESVITVRPDSSAVCPDCGSSMENAGWFESGDGRVEEISSIVAKFRSPSLVKHVVTEIDATETQDEGEGDLSKADETSKNLHEEENSIKDEALSNETPTELDPSEEVNEVEEETKDESEDVDEVELDSDERMAKKIDDLQDAMQKSITESKEETLARVSELEKQIGEAREAFIQKASELEESYNALGQRFEVSKRRLDSLANEFEKMNSASAVKKSAGLDGPVAKTVQKSSFWDGAFSQG